MKKKYLLGLTLSTALLSVSAFAQTYTFTNAAATGPNGPTQIQIDAAYAATNLNGAVTINTQGIQEWTVPTSGNYAIEVYGARGGGNGGYGAYVYGEFSLNSGQTLKILVGQMGLAAPNQVGNGGGGGSYVVDVTNTPLIIAGGGGGTAHNESNGSYNLIGGSTATDGNIGQYAGAGAGGTNGNGGFESYSTGNGTDNGGGGGGFLTNGGSSGSSFGGASFLNGGQGGNSTGGFGGGGGSNLFIYGCGSSPHGGSGGGGYSGGGAGGDNCNGAGGGGGSYNIGLNPTSIAAFNSTDGLVVITSMCTPTVSSLVPDAISLSDVNAECSATPSAPTATNSCGTVSGTPDVAFPITAQGTTVVTWTYDDGVNTTTQTQNVLIDDLTAPIADAGSLSDLTDICGVGMITPPTATDACMGTIIGVADVNFPYNQAGTSVITWSFDDGNGNISTQTQNVINASIDNTVTVDGAQLQANELVVAYQWLDCDDSYSEIAGEENQFYTPAATGNYAVEIYAPTTGCVDTSACYLIDFTGIDELIAPNGKSVAGYVDMMGRATNFRPNTPLIVIYSDGTHERVMKLEE